MQSSTLADRQAAIQAWLEEAWDYAVPRLLQSAGWLALGLVLFWVIRWTMGRVERAAQARTENVLDDQAARLARQLLLISALFFTVWRIALAWSLVTAASAVIGVWIVALAFPTSTFVTSLSASLGAISNS